MMYAGGLPCDVIGKVQSGQRNDINLQAKTCLTPTSSSKPMKMQENGVQMTMM